MSIFGVDYSYDHPSMKSMVDAGVKFIVRYLSHDPTKNLTFSEATAANGSGIWCVLVWESNAKRPLSGRSAGVADAEEAVRQARTVGMLDDRPIYFAVDWDATVAQQATIHEYLRGAISVLGKDRVGLYAGYGPIFRAFDANEIVWGWQTYAWSGGRWDNRAQIQQYKNGQSMGGGTVDFNRAVHDDYGQWKIGESPMAFTQADKDWLTINLPILVAKAVATAVAKTDGLYPASDDNPENPEWKLNYHIYSLGKIVRQIAAAVHDLHSPDIDEQAIAAAVVAGMPADTLANLIATRLGPEVATSVLDGLRTRLES